MSIFKIKQYSKNETIVINQSQSSIRDHLACSVIWTQNSSPAKYWATQKAMAQGPLSNNPTDHSVGFFPKLDERSKIIAQTFLRVRKDLTFLLSEKFLFGSLESLLDLENSRTLLDRLHWVSSNMQYAALEAFRDLAFGFLRSASSEEEGYELVVCCSRHLSFHQGALLLLSFIPCTV